MTWIFTVYNSMELKLKDKVIVVTGGEKGIGKGIVRALAEEGAIPVIVGRKQADNEQVRQEVVAAGGQAFCVEAELTRPEECERAINDTLARFGRIDGLVNNAGVNDGVGLENGSRSEEHTSELQSLMRKSYAVFCLKKKNKMKR